MAPATMADARETAARLRSAARRAAELTQATTTVRLALQDLAERVHLDMLPPDIRGPVARELERIAPPEPIAWRGVERLLRDAWGEPVGKIVGEIDKQPVSVRPASQVHRATLRDGGEVAVKLLRPRVAAAVRGELDLFDAVAALAGGVLEGIDAGAIAAEVRERVLDELDLEYEGGVQRSFHRALRRHPDLGVPAVHSALTAESVLVSDWVDGTPALVLDGAARERAAELLVRFHLGAALFGTIHADPDPRDALLDAGGRLWILDFGATRQVAPERVALAAAALDALAAGDARRLAGIVAEIGWLPEREAHDGHPIAHRILGPLLEGGEVALDAATLRGFAERGFKERRELLGFAAKLTAPPQDLWPLRMLGGLGTALATLGASADWLALGRGALRDGW